MVEQDVQQDADGVWQEEGGRDKAEATAQLMQHLRAMLYLCMHTLHQPLTVELLQDAWAILMKGAVTQEEKFLQTGFRACTASDGTGHDFMAPQFIPGKVKECLAKLGESLTSASDRGTVALQHAPAIAADLLYQLVHDIHPFINGNGRLGMLLMARILMKLGTPFPLPLLNGHKGAHNHYRHAISHYNKAHHPRRMRMFIVECLHFRWQDFAKGVDAASESLR